jgi:hypothetical protein
MQADLPPIQEIWVYLAGSPLFALVLTLGAYALGLAVYERTHRNPLAFTRYTPECERTVDGARAFIFG